MRRRSEASLRVLINREFTAPCAGSRFDESFPF